MKIASGANLFIRHWFAWAVRRSRRFLLAVLTVFFTVLSTMPLASAVDAASPVQRTILELFFIILLLSLVIGVLVHVVLLLAVKWYRDTPWWRPPKGGPRTHNRRLEVAWTIGPVVILAAVAILTISALGAIERPAAYDYKIQVIGAQWVWLFEYPEWNATVTGLRSSGTLYLEVGKTFLFEVTSRDVIHSFYVPDLGIKIDAVPGMTNIFWVRVDRPGTFTINCAEFCGAGHSEMNGEVLAFAPGTQDVPYGPPPSAGPPPVSDGTGLIVPVEFKEAPGPYGRWSINPSRLQFGQGIKVTLRVYNNETSVHQFRMATPYDIVGVVLDPNDPPDDITFWTNNTTPGVDYWCDISGHRELGMFGNLNVTGPRNQDIALTPAGISPGFLDLGPGQTLTITLRNQDATSHTFEISAPYGISFGTIAAGASVTQIVTFNATTVGATFGDLGDSRFVGGLRVSAIGFTPAPPPPPRGFPVLEVTFTLVGVAGAAALWLNVRLARDARRREQMPPEEIE